MKKDVDVRVESKTIVIYPEQHVKWSLHEKCTSGTKGDHDIGCATVETGEPQGRDFGPHLKSPLNDLIHLSWAHVRSVVHNPTTRTIIQVIMLYAVIVTI